MRKGTIATLLVVALLAGSGVGYLFGSSVVLTTTSVSTSVLTIGVTSTETYTLTSFTTSSIFYFLLSTLSPCSGPKGWVPCFGGGTPVVFNCAGAAATNQGCEQTVPGTLDGRPDIVVNVRFPFINATSPSWSNCLWSVTAPTAQGYAHCTFTNSTAFEVGELPPPVYPVGIPPIT